MKRTIEIAASFTGTISTGNYENEKPFFSLKEITELPEDAALDNQFIKFRQQELKDICINAFKQQAELSYQDKIARAYGNIRFYKGKDGLLYPSVTSIIGWDADFFCSLDELAQYAARGTVIHKLVELFLIDGKVRLPKDVPEIYPELVILSKGSLGLQVDDVNFPAFFKDYPIQVVGLEAEVINDEHRYGGRADILCIIDSKNPGKWDKVDGVKFDAPTILDVKTGSLDKTKCWKQLTAYAKACHETEVNVEQVGVIHLNKEVKQGYSKPSIITDLDKYWPLFLSDRDNFKKRFGV